MVSTRRKLTEGKLVLATHNRGKLEELSALLAASSLELLSAAALGLPVPDESAGSYEGNARLKAVAASEASGLPALADDSGFEIEALGGAPGVATADWALTPAGRDYAVARERAWSELERRSAPHPRRARLCCALVVAWPDGETEVGFGALEGRCVWPPRGGEAGEGFEPMFEPDGSTQTLSELGLLATAQFNHRGRAFAALRELFIAQLNADRGPRVSGGQP